MPITTTKNKAEVGAGGGNIIYIREVQESGADLGTPDTNHSLGHVRGHEILDDRQKILVHAESGDLVASLLDKRTITIKAELLQRGKAILDMLADEVAGKYYRVYIQESPMAGGKVVEKVFGICQILPKIDLKYQEGQVTVVPVEIDVLKNESSISVPNNTLPSEKKTASAMDIAAGKYWSRAET
jgi:hypothetical protein